MSTWGLKSWKRKYRSMYMGSAGAGQDMQVWIIKEAGKARGKNRGTKLRGDARNKVGKTKHQSSVLVCYSHLETKQRLPRCRQCNITNNFTDLLQCFNHQPVRQNGMIFVRRNIKKQVWRPEHEIRLFETMWADYCRSKKGEMTHRCYF